MGASGGEAEAEADGLGGWFDEEIILRKSFVGAASRTAAAAQPSRHPIQSLALAARQSHASAATPPRQPRPVAARGRGASTATLWRTPACRQAGDVQPVTLPVSQPSSPSLVRICGASRRL